MLHRMGLVDLAGISKSVEGVWAPEIPIMSIGPGFCGKHVAYFFSFEKYRVT